MATLEVKFWWLTSENKKHPQVGCFFFRTIASGGKTFVINSINEKHHMFRRFLWCKHHWNLHIFASKTWSLEFPGANNEENVAWGLARSILHEKWVFFWQIWWVGHPSFQTFFQKWMNKWNGHASCQKKNEQMEWMNLRRLANTYFFWLQEVSSLKLHPVFSRNCRRRGRNQRGRISCPFTWRRRRDFRDFWWNFFWAAHTVVMFLFFWGLKQPPNHMGNGWAMQPP